MEQLNLFSTPELSLTPAKKQLLMDVDQLQNWKSRIFKYQSEIRNTHNKAIQSSLFNLNPAHCDPDSIDPFSLNPESMSFYRLPSQDYSQPVLYFVIDSLSDIILYIGETKQNNKRWKNVHKCKDYISSYQDLHYRYKLSTAVNIAFWWDAPSSKQQRQKLEQILIQKWRSPFNKENWDIWSQPFT